MEPQSELKKTGVSPSNCRDGGDTCQEIASGCRIATVSWKRAS
jgi:hypothetical protein